LEMGSGIYVSKHIGLLRQKADHPARPLLRRLGKGER